MFAERGHQRSVDDGDEPAELLLPDVAVGASQGLGEYVVELRAQPQLHLAQFGVTRAGR